MERLKGKPVEVLPFAVLADDRGAEREPLARRRGVDGGVRM